MLSLEAQVCAHRGDASGVADSIHAMCKLSNSLEHEPIMISQLVRIAIGGMSAGVCRRLLPYVDFSDADLQRLAEDFRTTRYEGSFRRSLIGERAVVVQVFQNPSKSDEVGAELSKTVGPVLGLNRNEDLCKYLESLERMITAAAKPMPQAQNEFDQIEQELDALMTSDLNRARYVLTANLLPAVAGSFDAVGKGNATNVATTTAIAIKRYRRARGQIPEDLKQLVPDFLPEVPTDPFDGNPLRYIVKDGEYLIYSVGGNGQDDGGLDDGGKGKPASDIVFRVIRVETGR